MHHPTMAQLRFLFCRRGWLQDFDLIAPQNATNNEPKNSLGGQDPKPLVVQKIEEYAAKVRGKGFHLDVLDAALFADNHDAMLHVAFDPFPGGEFKFLSCVEYFKEISPTIDLDGSSELIRESPRTWCLVSVNANFDNKALRNHWVAGFFKDQLQPEMWDLLTAREIEKDSIEAAKVDAEVKKREEQFEQIKMAGIDETVTAKPLTPHIAARKGANHTQKIDMNGASTKYKTKHAKHPTPPLQNRSPSNLLPSKHDTTMPKMASTKSLPSKMGSFKMHFF